MRNESASIASMSGARWLSAFLCCGAIALFALSLAAQTTRRRSTIESAAPAKGGWNLMRVDRTVFDPPSRVSRMRTFPIIDIDGREVATREVGPVTAEALAGAGALSRFARRRGATALAPAVNLSASAIPTVHIRALAPGGARFTAPRYQRWQASPDGRTIAGAGDPTAPEHPFELTIAIFRDGRRVAVVDEKLSVESTLTVGVDGTVALVAHPAGDREHWFATVFDAEGRELFRHAMPTGRQAKDPVLTRDGLLARTHSLFGEGTDGEILRVDPSGVSSVLVAPDALELVGFAGADRVLVASATELVWLAAESGRVLWRRNESVRSAAPQAWTLWCTPSRDALAVLATDVQRRGAPRPPVTLRVWSAADGTLRAWTEIEPHGFPGEARLTNDGTGLLVDWHLTREVYAWNE